MKPSTSFVKECLLVSSNETLADAEAGMVKKQSVGPECYPFDEIQLHLEDEPHAQSHHNTNHDSNEQRICSRNHRFDRLTAVNTINPVGIRRSTRLH